MRSRYLTNNTVRSCGYSCADGAHRGESPQNTFNMRRSADQTTTFNRHLGTQPKWEFDWLRRGSSSLQEEVPLTGRARISGQAP